MHRIDTDGNVANLFTDGDPGIGQEATVVDDDWLNDMQENVAQAVEAASITLVKGTYTQLTSAIAVLARNALRSVTNTWAQYQTFVKGMIVTQSTANSDAIEGFGNGTGRGGYFEGGATGVAVEGFSSGTQPALKAWRSSAASIVADIQGWIDLSSGTAPAATANSKNHLTTRNLIQAWAFVSTDGLGGATLINGSNVASVAIVAGDISLTLAGAMANTNYGVFVNGRAATGVHGRFGFGSAVSTSVVGAEFQEIDGTTTTDCGTTAVFALIIVLGT